MQSPLQSNIIGQCTLMCEIHYTAWASTCRELHSDGKNYFRQLSSKTPPVVLLSSSWATCMQNSRNLRVITCSALQMVTNDKHKIHQVLMPEVWWAYSGVSFLSVQLSGFVGLKYVKLSGLTSLWKNVVVLVSTIQAQLPQNLVDIFAQPCVHYRTNGDKN